MKTLERKINTMKAKKISVSEKRQITIPKEYYDALNIGNEIECIMEDNCIIIKPVIESGIEEYTEYILQDIITEGYKGNEIIAQFKQRRQQLREAAKRMKKSIDEQTKETDKLADFKDIFGNEDDI